MTKYKVTCKKCGSSSIDADFSGSMDASDYHSGSEIMWDSIGDVQYFCYDCQSDFADVDIQEISVEAQEK
jgi:hypothetical protein